MNIWIFITIIGIVVAGLLVFRRTRERVVGICDAAIGLDAKKRENKEKIETLLRERSASAQGSGGQGFAFILTI